jgi:hypothetical protein
MIRKEEFLFLDRRGCSLRLYLYFGKLPSTRFAAQERSVFEHLM